MKGTYKLLSILGTLKAASRGPGPLARRVVRQQTHKHVSKALRRNRWTRP